MTIRERFDGELKRAQQAIDRISAGLESVRANIEMKDHGALLESAAVIVQSSYQLHSTASVLLSMVRRNGDLLDALSALGRIRTIVGAHDGQGFDSIVEAVREKVEAASR